MSSYNARLFIVSRLRSNAPAQICSISMNHPRYCARCKNNIHPFSRDKRRSGVDAGALCLSSSWWGSATLCCGNLTGSLCHQDRHKASASTPHLLPVPTERGITVFGCKNQQDEDDAFVNFTPMGE